MKADLLRDLVRVLNHDLAPVETWDKPWHAPPLDVEGAREMRDRLLDELAAIDVGETEAA